MSDETGLQSRTKKSLTVIALLALLPLAMLMAMWAALPEARNNVPITWPLATGIAWAAFWAVLGMADRYTRGESNAG